tara:strand:+ start:404 stop:1012 length:609 start_codon:yes stop_codon:yes gene_type:complete
MELDSLQSEQRKLDKLEADMRDKDMSPGQRRTLRDLIKEQRKITNRAYRVQEDEILKGEYDLDDGPDTTKEDREKKVKARRARQRENRKVRNEGKAIRNKALREIVKKADDIKNLNRSDIKQVRSLANQAASDYQAPKIKDLIKNTAQKTSASRSLLGAIAKGAGLFGAGVMVGELVRVHNQIKKNPTERYGSKTLFDILTK